MVEKKKRSKLKIFLIAAAVVAVIIFTNPEFKAKFLKIIGQGETSVEEVETP